MRFVALALALLAATTSCGGGDDSEPASSAAGAEARCGEGTPAGFSPVQLTATDGVGLNGFVAGSGATGIVFAHQRNGDACGWLPYAARLAPEAMVLAVDLRGFGASQAGEGDSKGRYDLDVAAAAAELRRRGATRVALVGASIGGTSVLVAAPELDPPPIAVVSLSGPTDADGLDARPAVGQAAWPTTLVVARDDGDYVDDAEALKAAAGAHAELVEVPAGGHGWSLVEPDAPSFGQVDALIRAAIG